MKVTEVIGDLTAAFIEWNKFFANSRYIRTKTSVAWEGYRKIWLSDNLTPREFLELVENNQFSFQVLEDGSIFQLLYEFDASGEKLTRASLAYYGKPPIFNEEEPTPESFDQNDTELSEEGMAEAEKEFCDLNSISRWLRIDYDCNENNSAVHGDCHMHVGGLPGARLLVRGVPGPAQFIEWVMALFYPETYRNHRLTTDGNFVDIAKLENANRKTVVFSDHEFYKYLTHISVPS